MDEATSHSLGQLDLNDFPVVNFINFASEGISRRFPHRKLTNQHLSEWRGGVRAARGFVYPRTSTARTASVVYTV